MKKYFYTDPLVAAWMTKHHGFEIIELENEAHIASYMLLLSMALHKPSKKEWRLLISPNSLHLLKPQVGDLTEEPASNLNNYRVRPSGSEQFAATTLAECYASELADMGKLKIIQRKAVSFMWPESEEV
jgi:hypothetical protein